MQLFMILHTYIIRIDIHPLGTNTQYAYIHHKRTHTSAHYVYTTHIQHTHIHETYTHQHIHHILLHIKHTCAPVIIITHTTRAHTLSIFRHYMLVCFRREKAELCGCITKRMDVGCSMLGVGCWVLAICQ